MVVFPMDAVTCSRACEFRRKVWRLAAALVLAAATSALAPTAASRAGLIVTAGAAVEQPAPDAPPGHEAGAAGHESIWPLVARLVNFAILVGTLIYFLRSPFGQYVTGRASAIRQDLVTAAEMRRTAAAQIDEIDRRLQALPQDIENLKHRGAEEIAEEEARIAQAAEAERQRLLEQTRREIDVQLRAAKNELVKYAAELAVGTAAERIKRTITTNDHLRLVDQYVDRVKAPAPEP